MVTTWALFVAAAASPSIGAPEKLWVAQEIMDAGEEVVAYASDRRIVLARLPRPSGGQPGYLFDVSTDCRIAMTVPSASDAGFDLVIGRLDKSGNLSGRRALVSSSAELSMPRFSSSEHSIAYVERPRNVESHVRVISDEGVLVRDVLGSQYAWNSADELFVYRYERSGKTVCHSLSPDDAPATGGSPHSLRICGGLIAWLPAAGYPAGPVPLVVLSAVTSDTDAEAQTKDPNGATVSFHVRAFPLPTACEAGISFSGEPHRQISLRRDGAAMRIAQVDVCQLGELPQHVATRKRVQCTPPHVEQLP